MQCRRCWCPCFELVNMAMEGFRFCRSWLFTSCVLLFAFAAGNETRTTQNKNNCSYAITIQTTCTHGAETSGHVAVRFGDTNSTDIVVRRLNTKRFQTLDPLQPAAPLDDVPRKPFRACALDEFRVVGECIESRVCYLYLKLAGSDDWRPGFAKVEVLEGPHLSSEYFYFRRYLPRQVWHGSDSCEKEVTPFGIKSKRKVNGTKRFVV